MLWHILKFYLGFVIAAYFKRIQVKNAHYLKVKGPVIVAINHPNAFMDPIAFTTQVYPPRLMYLARGDAFKKGIVSAILESLGIIPIFRIQDGGKEGLQKNNETYERVNTLLSRNKKIIIFAEGLCIQERRLRPLKKGVPRMIFGAVDAKGLNDLIVVPVGLNYKNPSSFRSELFCNVGEPIKIADYMANYAEFPAKTMNQFLADLYPKMKELIVHIQQPSNEKIIENCEEIYRLEYFEKHNFNLKKLEHDFEFSTVLTKVIEDKYLQNPTYIEELTTKTTAYLNQLKTLELKDWLFSPIKQSSVSWLSMLMYSLFTVVTFPLYIVGCIGNFLPFVFTSFIVNKKVKLVEFKSSFAMGIGAFAFLIYYIFQFMLIKQFTPHAWWALAIIVCFILSGIFIINTFSIRKKTMGLYKFLVLKKNNPKLVNELYSTRENLINEIENLFNAKF